MLFPGISNFTVGILVSSKALVGYWLFEISFSLGTFRGEFWFFMGGSGGLPNPTLIEIVGDCVSLLHIQTEMDEIDSGEFGIALDWIERGFLPGDVIKCFYLDSEHREPDWVWQ